MTTNHPATMKRILIYMVLIAISQNLFSQEWTVPIETGCIWSFYDVVTVDNGEAVLCVGLTAERNGFLVKINKEGNQIYKERNYIDRVVHLPGMMLSYYSAVQLDNGNYMVFGVCDDSLCDINSQRYIRVDVYDDDLEPIRSMMYDVNDETFDHISGARYGLELLKSALSPSGTVILASTSAFYVEEYDFFRSALQLYELDYEGNILVKKPHISAYAASIEEVTYEPHSDNLFVAVYGGSFPNNSGVPGIYVVDTSLEIVARQHLVPVQGGYAYQVDPIVEISTDGKWIDGDRLILHAQKPKHNRQTFYYSSLYVIDSALNVYGELHLPPYDSTASMPRGTSSAYINDSTIFAITYCTESVYSDIAQTNVILVDKHLNLLGRKAFKESDFMYLPGQPAVFNDGGCLIPMGKRRGFDEPGDPEFEGVLMKFRREDVEITWDVVQESGTRERLLPYPNPTDGNINIPLPEAVSDNARILLFDASGVKCLDSAICQEGNLIRLNTGNLDSGLYLYRIVTGSRTLTEGKFVKD